MAAVKGSKQHRMVVVPYRPFYKSLMVIFFLLGVAMLSWMSYEFGALQGLQLKGELVREKDLISNQLEEANLVIQQMRQEIADLKVGGEIDSKANEEVRETIEALQSQLAEKNEEISFYKGAMVQNAEKKGLRVEMLDISSIALGRVKYSFLLTQVVEKHDYVEGGVQIELHGKMDDRQKVFQLKELDQKKPGAIKFRFRYFQVIKGEMVIPNGFLPREFIVLAKPRGSNARPLQKKFAWPEKGV